MDELAGERSEGADPRPKGAYWIGCGVPLTAAVVGFIAFLVADGATPCDCEGDPDRSFAEMMSAAPIGAGVALLTLLVLVGLFLVTSSRRSK